MGVIRHRSDPAAHSSAATRARACDLPSMEARGEIDTVTAKRVGDLVMATALLIITAPVFAVVTLAQRIEGTPVLWRSPRLGRGARRFDLLSFRTMDEQPIIDADARFTRTGRFLRNYSLDHLPTLVNVLRGDMSLIGPRPTEPDRVDLHDTRWQRVLSVRPGMVSYAIIHLARTYNTAPAEQRLALEMAYVDQAGLIVDLRLLIQAAVSLVRSRGNIKARGHPAD
jgi:lipopolysaccharide/colanic/teichoic acid biosynthesis glycosyltransferase